MKELSIEEKAERYEEAIKKAKTLYENANGMILKKWVEQVFPEFKESEGERIRKALIEYFSEQCDMSDWNGVYGYQVVNWLEKQGTVYVPKFRVGDKLVSTKNPHLTYEVLEVGHINELGNPEYKAEIFTDGKAENPHNIHYMECRKVDEWAKLIEQQPADKVEPKFEQGKWIVWKDKPYKVNYNGCGYELFDQNGLSTSWDYKTIEDNAYLWTVQDAKGGDVLKEDSCTFIIERMKHDGTAIVHCCLFDDGDFSLDSTLSFDVDSTYPATKEQRDQLEKAMADAGYTFDFEKKELKKIELKFNIGDEIKTTNEEPLTITKIDEKGYWSEDLFICSFDDADKWELVEQKPVEMKSPEESLGISSEEYNRFVNECIFGDDKDADKAAEEYRNYRMSCGVKDPVMLNEIEEAYYEGASRKQKPEWSEEDKAMLDFAIRAIGLCKQYAINNQVNGYNNLPNVPQKYQELKDWLKSLKNKVQLQPKQEWSQEDEAHIDSLLKRLEGIRKPGAGFISTRFTISEDKDWLKSLHPQSRWNPTEEQMDCLKEAADNYHNPDVTDSLYEIYKQLKAL